MGGTLHAPDGKKTEGQPSTTLRKRGVEQSSEQTPLLLYAETALGFWALALPGPRDREEDGRVEH